MLHIFVVHRKLRLHKYPTLVEVSYTDKSEGTDLRRGNNASVSRPSFHPSLSIHAMLLFAVGFILRILYSCVYTAHLVL